MPDGPERIDYRETSDITEVHGAIRREHSDPRADVTPIPLWLTIICGVAICWAGSYVGAFHADSAARGACRDDWHPIEVTYAEPLDGPCAQRF